MWFGIVSLFPEMFRAITDYGVTGRAVKNGIMSIKIWNPRDFTHSRYCSVDDRPYGGGPGMLMTMQPLLDAILSAKSEAGNNVKVVYLSPQGYLLSQENVRKLAMNQKLILVCGRYEGIDERIIQSEVDEEYSIGDYILSGGELPAMVLIDTISRLIPRILGHKTSIEEESFSNGLLEYPHYTRPQVLRGMKVPSVLVSGNHSEIRRWRLKQSLGRTWIKRPELLKKLTLTDERIRLLLEFKSEYMRQKCSKYSL